MEPYSTWNRAIVDAMVRGVPKGRPVYLNIDEDVIASIGSGLPTLKMADAETCVTDFEYAVKNRVVHGETVDLSTISSEADGIPNVVGFLAAMVLAAN